MLKYFINPEKIKQKLATRILDALGELPTLERRNISPVTWEKIVVPINIQIQKYVIGIIAGFEAIKNTLIVSALLILIVVYTPYGNGYFLIIGMLTPLITFAMVSTNKAKEALEKSNEVVSVPGGFAGQIKLFGQEYGSMNPGEDIMLSSGDFRALSKIPYISETIFEAIQTFKELPSFEYSYGSVLSADTMSFRGEHTFSGIISNPYVLNKYILNTIKTENEPLLEVENFVEEISLINLKNAFDEINHTVIIGPRGTEVLVENFVAALSKQQDNPECKKAKRDFYTLEKHPAAKIKKNYPDNKTSNAFDLIKIGITGSFGIKTAILPPEIEKQYATQSALGSYREIQNTEAEVKAFAAEEMERKKADAEAYRVKKIGSATTAAVASSLDEYKDRGYKKEAAMLQASLDNNSYTNEQLLVVSDSQGRTIKGAFVEAGIPNSPVLDTVIDGLLVKLNSPAKIKKFIDTISKTEPGDLKKAITEILTST